MTRRKTVSVWMIVLGVVIAVTAAGLAWAYLTPGNANAGDTSKLGVTFTAEEQRMIDEVVVTPDELAAATCHDGASCWIAVDGVVYDMSGFPAGLRGRHHGVQAGTDATDAFVRSGHGRSVLEKMPVVGRLGS